MTPHRFHDTLTFMPAGACTPKQPRHFTLTHALSPALSLIAALALTACSTTLIPPSDVQPKAPDQWQAPLPHQGDMGALSQWWERQGDPVLVELIAAAQAVSPTVSNALARIENARANQAAARSALLPDVNAEVSASRSQQALTPQGNIVQAGFKASWELDLVGANRAVSRAAVAQVEGSRARWHDARVSVAAEVAYLYYAQASCMQLIKVAEQDAASRRETTRLATISTQAGFTAPATAALARASAADSNSRLTQQTAQCDINTKALVALTDLPEATLRSKLAAAFAKGVLAQPIAVSSVPAQTITQRPDVFAAERDVLVAAAAVGSAKAQRYPRLKLNGSIAAARLGNNGTDFSDSIWSIGPLTLSLPLFDGGQRVAAVQSSEAAYRSSITVYQATVRQAVREVEEALVALQSTEARTSEAMVSVQGYAESLAATQQRYQQGFASLMELEDARRLALAAQSAQLALQTQRNQAWVSLYRALGGGFEAKANTETAQTP